MTPDARAMTAINAEVSRQATKINATHMGDV
jgi:hypothetical protein